MYAQLFHETEEGNVYTLTERVPIHDSLVNLLAVPQEYKELEAFWVYFEQSQMEADLAGSWHPTDNNRQF